MVHATDASLIPKSLRMTIAIDVKAAVVAVPNPEAAFSVFHRTKRGLLTRYFFERPVAD